jgi:hypothetical protein
VVFCGGGGGAGLLRFTLGLDLGALGFAGNFVDDGFELGFTVAFGVVAFVGATSTVLGLD